MNEGLRKTGWFLISLLSCYLAAFIGSFFTIDAINTWYTTIQKPSFNPPNWLFGPVWSALYTMMGVCFYLINSSYHPLKKTAQYLFILQLILNSLWSIIFFNFHTLGLAFAEIIVLWLVILFLILKSKPINKWCSILLVPYLLWVSFATLLSGSIWWLNR
jgi:tryptophan-rich sensory protein